MTTFTEPAGRVFVSYRRTRAADVALLTGALRDRGIPTWVDTANLRAEPTSDELRRVLADPATAGAIMYFTPDVADSATILNVEAPAILRRHRADDAFWIQSIAAGGLGYSEAADIVAGHLGTDDLARWNIARVKNDPLSAEDASHLAHRCLARRLAAIHESLPPGDPVRVTLHARGTPALVPDAALSLDWTRHFTDRFVCDDWSALATAAQEVAALVRVTCPGRDVLASGTPALPAALLLGAAFPTRDAALLSWRQRQPNGYLHSGWSAADADNRDAADAAGWTARRSSHDSAADACAVLVNITDETTGAFAASRTALPRWRTVIEIGPVGRQRKTDLTAQENASLAHLVIDEIRAARADHGLFKSVHFFLAAPAGFAVVLGTLLATLPEVVSYEYDTGAGIYRRAVELHP